MKKWMLLIICAIVIKEVSAQRLCGAQMIRNEIIRRDADNAIKLLHSKEHIKAQEEIFLQTKQAKQKTTSSVTIPVVFHIILTQAQQIQLGGVSGIEQRVLTQLEALNEDFSKQHADTNLIPSPFKPFASNTQIQFALARRKPDGSSTNGYHILTSATTTYTYPAVNAKKTSQGGADAWDPNRYLNIWVLNLGNSLLGFTVPRSLLPFHSFGELGVVLNSGAFGRRTSANQFFLSGFDKGRTLTHEIGHYFELEHIWGDDNGQCPGSGGMDDGIADTPPQASESTGNPIFPRLDACSPNVPGIMFMNYMDYSNDASLLLFTHGQSNRMNSMLVPVNAQDHGLTAHPELLQWPTDVADLELEAGTDIYPNPSSGLFTIAVSRNNELKHVQILNLMAQTVHYINPTNQAIANYHVDLSGLSKGVYLVQCTFAAGTVMRKIILQ